MRVIFYIFLSIFTLFLGLVILMPSFFDVATYKKKITQIIYDNTGAIIKINGPIKISALPTPNISISEIEILNYKKETLLKADIVSIFPKILSVLTGNISFSNIKIIKANLNYEIYKNNEHNWKFNKNEPIKTESKSLRKGPEERDDKKQSKYSFYNFKAFTLKDVSINYKDKKFNKTVRINDFKIKNSNKKSNIRGNFVFDNEIYKFKHNLSNIEDKEVMLKGSIVSQYLDLKKDITFSKKNLEFKGKINFISKDIYSFLKNEYFRNIPVEVKSDLYLSKNRIKLNNINLKSNFNANGELEYIVGKNKKNINIYLKTNEIDFDKNTKKINFIANKNKNKNKNKNIEPVKEKIITTGLSKQYDKLYKIIEPYNIKAVLILDKLIYKNKQFYEAEININKKKNLDLSLEATQKSNAFVKASALIKKNKKIKIKLDAKNIQVTDFIKKNDFLSLAGTLDAETEIESYLNQNKNFIKNMSGISNIFFTNIIIKNLNIERARKNLLNLEAPGDIVSIADGVFNSDTYLKNQKIKLLFDSGIVSLQERKITLDNFDFFVAGKYNLINKKNDINISFDKDSNTLFSFFNIKLQGMNNDLKKEIVFDEKKVNKYVEKIVEKKVKKMIKDKIEKNFDNVIEKLLE